MAGKFIVIEGTDGSGKATQTGLLVERLKAAGRKVAMVDFPRYGNPSSHFIEKYLNGGYGDMSEIGPEKASLFYALDRFDASPDIKSWLADGAVGVANRYVASNMGHQGSKIKDAEARSDFFKWIHDLEYGILGIPRPDINILLHVPAETAYELVGQKGDRAYLKGGRRDMHEGSVEHLRQAETTYKEMMAMFPQEFLGIECAPGGKLLPPEEISAKIWESVQNYI